MAGGVAGGSVADLEGAAETKWWTRGAWSGLEMGAEGFRLHSLFSVSVK